MMEYWDGNPVFNSLKKKCYNNPTIQFFFEPWAFQAEGP
jgi:hypothetical protein